MRAVIGLVLVLLAGAGALAAKEEGDPAQRGREVYLQYCASCHGTAAKGDGVVGEAFRNRVPDLTRISARRNGRFPAEEVHEIIDGRRRVVPHGSSDMPVWGERLAQEIPDETSRAQDAFVQGRISLLVAYLRSIQVAGR